MKVLQVLLLASLAVARASGATNSTTIATPVITPRATSDDKNTTLSAEVVPTPTPAPKVPTPDSVLVSGDSSFSATGDTVADLVADTTGDSASGAFDSVSLASSLTSDSIGSEDDEPAASGSDSGPTGEGGGAIPPRLVPLPSSSSGAATPPMTATRGSVAALVVAVGVYFL